MLPYVVRFVCGGVVVASVPWLARHYTPYVAGLFVLVPVVTGTGLYFLGRAAGSNAVHRAAGGALLGVPALVCFLGTIYLLSRDQRGITVTMCVALCAWLVFTIPFLLLSPTSL